jgi:hypothetical protein
MQKRLLAERIESAPGTINPTRLIVLDLYNVSEEGGRFMRAGHQLSDGWTLLVRRNHPTASDQITTACEI